jgi:nitrogen regulatory protein P-II 1
MLNQESAPPPAQADAAMQMIMAIVQRGKADKPIKAALKAGAQSAVAFFGRGLGIRERLGLLGLAVQPEKEIVMIVVPVSLTDLVVRAMVRAGNLDQPGVGFLFVMPVEEVAGLGTLTAPPVQALAQNSAQSGA